MRRATNLRNEKGITLIELLAVIVILGIIAAIAVPAIGNMIENSKKDAHIANARAMIEAARLHSIEDSSLRPSKGKRVFVSLGYLISQGYIDKIESPGDEPYEQSGGNPTDADHANNRWADGKATFVVIDNTTGTMEYYVKLLTYNDKVILELTEESNITRNSISIQ
ncbi:type II secretion system protein [Lysinibacillus sp. BW-2-10]|uniref:type II secretion system protein n=1 Tax=Lysinibacillus sp. BW-2-10 TaxID=2590030 RepID=UPI00117F7F21|nr:prepilin-type N-terminal cleavage/methylation domain-containing protein [Lysinibacillus sp. BW-2-10]TSI07704.1 prepilin-type N-terminal cleavage/methylation domain-containing protein [Lysinibacillus sp. BW-2-10]